jgi:hypothetical protein
MIFGVRIPFGSIENDATVLLVFIADVWKVYLGTYIFSIDAKMIKIYLERKPREKEIFGN